MYNVKFEIWRGFSSPTQHPAGMFYTLGEAISCAQICHGWVEHNNRIVADYRIK